ncbi:PAS domain-containing sensor histidine kinase [Pontibacter ruber]|uniref:histidine kinase n=1 Tax=Pontibacter ruber TaxID=1343895 RepID=A0ABW5CZF8_9BACT|nr:PAS domain-containing protein [Pontibacter ruber]
MNLSASQTILDFKNIFQALPGLYLILSPELTIIAVSDSYLAATLTAREEILGKYVFDVFPDNPHDAESKSVASLKSSLNYVLEHRQSHFMPTTRYDVPSPGSSGHTFERRYWAPCNTPVLAEDGTVAYIIHEVRNVTEQVQVEKEIASRQHNLLLMAEAAGGAVWECDIPNNKMTWSASYKDIFGYDDDALETVPGRWSELVHPDDLQQARKSIDRVVAAKGKTWTGQYRYRKADNSYTTVLDHGYILYDLEGRPVHMLGTMVDLSKQLEQERKLKESNSRFELIAKATNDVIWDWNLLDDSLWWNEGMQTLYGYKAEAIEPTIVSWTNYIHPDDLLRVKESIHHVIDSGETNWESEYRFRCANGSYKIILDRGYVIHNPEGAPVRMIGAMLDITEAKRLEQQQQESTAFARRILESLPLMAWTATPNGAVDYYSQSWFDYTGANFDELKAWGWSNIIHPDDADETLRLWKEALLNGEPYAGENRWKSAKTGTYRWFLARAVPIRDEEGNITMWAGSHTDIHDQKTLQQQLEESSRKFLFLSESIPQMVWSANPDGHIDYTNHRWYEYTKMSEESLGFGWAPAIHPDELQNLMGTWMHCVATGDPLEFEVRFQDMEAKTYRWFLLRALPMRNEGKEIVKWFGTATDIHDQKQLMQQLEETTRRFRFLGDSIVQLVWITDASGYHEYFNQRWRDYTGLTLEESMGFIWNDVLHPEDQQRAWDRWQHSLRTGEFYEIEYRFRNGRDGTYRWFLGQAMPMRDNDGNILKWFGTCTDIEDHKRAEEELLEKNLELERINQDLDSFVYTASHDLKLPIINMAGIFEELTQNASFNDPDAPRMIDMFNKSLQQIHSTIHDLAEVVKVQRIDEREREQVQLEQLVEDVQVSIQDLLRDTRATIITDFSAAPGIAFIKANLKSIFYNLITNAIKYRAHDRQPMVHLSTRHKGDYIELKVQDNGMGIDMNKHQSKLFQMFKRFHNHVHGSGLGLYIVNRLLTNNGGYINIESTLNEGTTFYLYFKQKKA